MFWLMRLFASFATEFRGITNFFGVRFIGVDFIGSDIECQLQLQSFGILSQHFPVSPSGEYQMKYHQEWLRHRQQLEAEEWPNQLSPRHGSVLFHSDISARPHYLDGTVMNNEIPCLGEMHGSTGSTDCCISVDDDEDLSSSNRLQYAPSPSLSIEADFETLQRPLLHESQDDSLGSEFVLRTKRRHLNIETVTY